MEFGKNIHIHASIVIVVLRTIIDLDVLLEDEGDEFGEVCLE